MFGFSREYILMLRSIVIEYFKTEIRQQNVGITFTYFDYKDHESQTPTKLVRSFLRQLVCQLMVSPSELEMAYKHPILKSVSEHDFEFYLQLFWSIITRFDSVYVFFDAFDECHEQHQRCIFSLIRDLSQSGAKVMLTSRDHLEILQPFESEALRISANINDVERYICVRLEKERHLTEEIKGTIIKKLKSGADGMYNPKANIVNQPSGFVSLNFK